MRGSTPEHGRPVILDMNRVSVRPDIKQVCRECHLLVKYLKKWVDGKTVVMVAVVVVVVAVIVALPFQ